MELYKIHIRSKILKLIKQNMREAYGGATEKTKEERFEEHINDNQPKEMNELNKTTWKVDKATTYTVRDDDIEKNKANIKLLEDFMINELDKIFGLNVLNKHNINGELKQTGGSGIVPNKGDRITFYIIWR